MSMPLVQVAVALSLCAVPTTGWLDGTRPVARPAQRVSGGQVSKKTDILNQTQ
jgi:hypothetical protein